MGTLGQRSLGPGPEEAWGWAGPGVEAPGGALVGGGGRSDWDEGEEAWTATLLGAEAPQLGAKCGYDLAHRAAVPAGVGCA